MDISGQAANPGPQAICHNNSYFSNTSNGDVRYPRQGDGLGKARELEYVESASYNTFEPFQNKEKIHQHLQRNKMLCAFKKIKI